MMREHTFIFYAKVCFLNLAEINAKEPATDIGTFDIELKNTWNKFINLKNTKLNN
jgi:hypothetical protein